MVYPKRWFVLPVSKWMVRLLVSLHCQLKPHQRLEHLISVCSFKKIKKISKFFIFINQISNYSTVRELPLIGILPFSSGKWWFEAAMWIVAEDESVSSFVTLTSIWSAKECVQLVARNTSIMYLVIIMRMVLNKMMMTASAFIGEEVHKASLELIHYFIVSLHYQLVVFSTLIRTKSSVYVRVLTKQQNDFKCLWCLHAAYAL